MPKRDISWWFWLATDVALANSLFIDREAIKATIALAAAQVPVFAIRGGGLASFPSQVRLAYLCLLVIGLWHPLGVVYWIQLVGTTAAVLFGYCFLARCLSLLPFNRATPLSLRLMTGTFFAPPIHGSVSGRDSADMRARPHLADGDEWQNINRSTT
jgi:hypothetical protein